MLVLFVREGWLDEDAAAAMLTWPHSGFGVHVGPAIAAQDRAAVLRVARYGARAPVAESRLRYYAVRAEVELVSDARDGPYVGVHRMAAVEFLARLVDHIPAKGEVRARYYGAYASRRWGWWRRPGVVLAGAGQEEAVGAEREAEPRPARKSRRRRWAELLRWVFEVDVTVCPGCGVEMRILASVTKPAVVTHILDHVTFAAAIVAAYTVLEEMGVQVKASKEKPSRIDGRWNPKVHADLIDRLVATGLELQESVVWTVRRSNRRIESRRPIVEGSKASWASGTVRDAELPSCDAIARCSYLRSKVASHGHSSLLTSLTGQDVGNVRRVAVHILGVYLLSPTRSSGIHRTRRRGRTEKLER